MEFLNPLTVDRSTSPELAYGKDCIVDSGFRDMNQNTLNESQTGVSDQTRSCHSLFKTKFSQSFWESWTQTPLNIPSADVRWEHGNGVFNGDGKFVPKYVEEGVKLILDGKFDRSDQDQLLRSFVSSKHRRRYLVASLQPKQLALGRSNSSNSMFEAEGFSRQKWEELVHDCDEKGAARRRGRTTSIFYACGSIKNKFIAEALPLIQSEIHQSSKSKAHHLRKFVNSRIRRNLSAPRPRPLATRLSQPHTTERISNAPPSTKSRNDEFATSQHGALERRSVSTSTLLPPTPPTPPSTNNGRVKELSTIDLSGLGSLFRVIDRYVTENFEKGRQTSEICGSECLEAIKNLTARTSGRPEPGRIHMLELLNISNEASISDKLSCLPPHFSVSCLVHSLLGFFTFKKLSDCEIVPDLPMLSTFIKNLREKYPYISCYDLENLRKASLKEEFCKPNWIRYRFETSSEWAVEAHFLLSKMTNNMGHNINQLESLRTLFAEVLDLHFRLVIQLSRFNYFWPAHGDKINPIEYLNYNSGSVVSITKLFGLQITSQIDGTDPLVLARAEVWS